MKYSSQQITHTQPYKANKQYFKASIDIHSETLGSPVLYKYIYGKEHFNYKGEIIYIKNDIMMVKLKDNFVRVHTRYPMKSISHLDQILETKRILYGYKFIGIDTPKYI
jgi:hypothetical protein